MRLLIIAVLLFTSSCVLCDSLTAQQNDDGGQIQGEGYSVVKNADGSVSYERFAPVDVNSDLGKSMVWAKKMEMVNSQNSGFNLLLTRFGVDQVNALSNLELSVEQKQQLEEIVADYKEKSEDDSISNIQLRMNVAEKVRDLLLPEQLASLSGAKLKIGNVFQFVKTPNVSEYLKLTENQLRQVQHKVEKINESLEQELREHQRMLERKREELAEVFNTLDKEQREKLSGLVGRKVDKYFQNSNLQFMYQTTMPPTDDAKKEKP